MDYTDSCFEFDFDSDLRERIELDYSGYDVDEYMRDMIRKDRGFKRDYERWKEENGYDSWTDLYKEIHHRSAETNYKEEYEEEF